MLETLMQVLATKESYAELRGAAFGLSAFVKGLGLPSLKAHDVVPRLREAAAEGTVAARQGDQTHYNHKHTTTTSSRSSHPSTQHNTP